jgi:SAM-dependent methyltransferase
MKNNTQKITKQDVIGQAILDYHLHGHAEDIHVLCPDFEPDIIPVSHFFRPFEQMPVIEQQSLSHCQGHILDIGAGAGTHALYLKQEGYDVTTLDISPGAVRVQEARGISRALCADIHDPLTTDLLHASSFDTLLMLMNGIGVAGTLSGLHTLLAQAKNWLRPNGSILLDSSDLIFLHEDDDGAVTICLTDNYYGELTYQLKYRDMTTLPFPWLFVDFETLSECAQKHGYRTEILFTGDHYEYLARLTLEQATPQE